MISTSEILKKVRRIEIKTRGLSSHVFSGEYHSAFKGRGMSFSEVREYSPGDDVRTIDWNVTARFSTPFIKVFEEERELTLMLLVDISNSSLFGTKGQIKRDVITEIAAVLSFSAITNNDKVGVIFFSDQVNKYIPPKKGKSHVLRIIREMITIQPRQKTITRIDECLRFFNNASRKRTITFLLSDFISAPYQDSLRLTAKRHDLIGIQVYDPLDKELPNAGLIRVQDSETGEMRWMDTSDKKLRQHYTASFLAHQQYSVQAFHRAGAEMLAIRTGDDYVKILQGFFIGRS
jgi:uncharacterized protein (DUF58 family)